MVAADGSPAYEWEGKLVRLRAYEAGDADTFARWERDSDQQRLGGILLVPTSMVRFEALFSGTGEAERHPDALSLVIETLAGVLAGTISARDVNPRMGTFSYGITIAREQRQHGYAAEAVRLLLRYLFREKRYQKVNAQVFSFNEPSQRFHEAFGFVSEGRIRRGWYTGGEYHDILLYGMTAEEFEEKHGG